MALSDAELMLRTGQDDLEAFGMLFERHQAALYLFLRRLLGNTAAAEDAVQEVFWRVWRYRTTFNGAREFTGWLYVIARHAAMDEIRRRSLHARSFCDLAVGQEARIGAGDRSVPGSDESLRLQSMREEVQRALLQLTPEQRTCVILREYEGRSHREIAEILGCSEGNARVLAHRARQAMRKLLASVLEQEELQSEGSCVSR